MACAAGPDARGPSHRRRVLIEISPHVLNAHQPLRGEALGDPVGSPCAPRLRGLGCYGRRRQSRADPRRAVRTRRPAICGESCGRTSTHTTPHVPSGVEIVELRRACLAA